MERLINSTASNVFNNFIKLNKIPRCSNNEEEISNYLRMFGESLGLTTIQDEFLNVYIKKPATIGYENHEPVVLQAHMDMVCEKTEDSDHDFCKDPIEVHVEGDYIKANKTTLGADNGIGVALALDILENDSLAHPPIEVIITATEETGMDGVIGLSKDLLKGRKLINIDTEEEGTLIIGCAGGINSYLDLDIKRESGHSKKTVKLSLAGLKGGHSGMTIGSNNINAIKLISEYIRKIRTEIPMSLLAIKGGTKHNAIPSQAEIIVGIEDEDLERFKEVYTKVTNEYVENSLKREPDISFAYELVGEEKTFITTEDAKKMLNLIQLLPHGVNTMDSETDQVQSSNNLAIVRTEEDKFKVSISIRSSKEAERENLINKVEEVAKLVGARMDLSEGYPMWEPKEVSPLKEVARIAYKDLTEEDLNISTIHAGLECGIISEKYPEMDMISIGPNIEGAHTPEEKLSIRSTEFIREYIYDILARL